MTSSGSHLYFSSPSVTMHSPSSTTQVMSGTATFSPPLILCVHPAQVSAVEQAASPESSVGASVGSTVGSVVGSNVGRSVSAAACLQTGDQPDAPAPSVWTL